MIKPNQIKAARALLGWQQKDLARISGVSELSIINIENGKTSPQQTTMDKIVTAFAMSGIQFSGKRVELKENSIIDITGPHWLSALLNDLETISAEQKQQDNQDDWIVFHTGDNETSNHLDALKPVLSNNAVKTFASQDHTPLLGKDSTYKYIDPQYIPAEHADKDIFAVCYDNKLALVKQAFDQARISVYRNAELISVIRNLSELLWASLPDAKDAAEKKKETSR